MSYSSCAVRAADLEHVAEARVVTSAGGAPVFVITAFVVTVVPWKSVSTSDGDAERAHALDDARRSRGGVDGTFATRDSPVSLTRNDVGERAPGVTTDDP